MPPSGAGAVGSHADRELTKATQIGQLACQYLRFSQEKLKKKNVGLSGMLETLTQELSELQEQHAKRVSGAARHASTPPSAGATPLSRSSGGGD